jgi:hypothetical protein
MRKKQNLQESHKQALNIPDVSIRLMTFEEIFESRMEYLLFIQTISAILNFSF